MDSRTWLVSTLLSVIMLGTAEAQVIQQQTVQLPTFHYFGVSTTVVVPTRGTIPLGGVTYGGITRTPYDKVGSSFERFSATNQLSLGATVIDHNEIDRALLAEAARRRGANVDILGRPIEVVDGDVYLRRGREAERTGQVEVAQVFYRRAAKLGSAAAQERLAQLERAAKK